MLKLEKNPKVLAKLQSLFLSNNNQIGQEGLEALADAIDTGRLESLRLLLLRKRWLRSPRKRRAASKVLAPCSAETTIGTN